MGPLSSIRRSKFLARKKILKTQKKTSEGSSSSESSSDEIIESSTVTTQRKVYTAKEKMQKQKHCDIDIIELEGDSETDVTDSSSSISTETEEELEEVLEEELVEYVVEKILNMKIVQGRKFFYVKWQGWSEDDNSWEPEENMTGSRDLLKEFLKERRLNNSAAAMMTKNSKNISISDNSPHKKAKLSNFELLQEETENRTARRKQALKSAYPVQPEPIIKSDVTFKFRIWLDQTVQWLYLDIAKTPKQEQFYKMIITDNVNGKDLKWVFGATESANGEKFCLVQFEDSDFVEVVPPKDLLDNFPYLEKYYSNQL